MNYVWLLQIAIFAQQTQDVDGVAELANATLEI